MQTKLFVKLREVVLAAHKEITQFFDADRE
jgi:hypothetical protein